MQGNIAGIPRWESLSRAGIYFGHSSFCARSVVLVLNQETGYVSPQFYVVFDDEFSTVPIMREVKIPPNWKYLVQNRSLSVVLYNIYIRDTWLTPYIEEYPS